jgi:hypothetical protein
MRTNKLVCAVLSAVMTFAVTIGTALTANAAGAAVGETSRYDEFDLNGMKPENSRVKPTLSVSRLEIPVNVAKANPNQTVSVKVANANRKYSSVGLHICFDSRLGIIPFFEWEDDPELELMCEWGAAGKALGGTSKRQDAHTFFATAACKDDYGLNGELLNFTIILPADVEVGDEYPIEILYRKGDRFASTIMSDEDSDLMEAWTFTNGIEQGYIRITDPVELEEEESEKPVLNFGDPNGDGKIDSSDATLILGYYSKLQTGALKLVEIPTDVLAAADVNFDGFIDSKDATIILSYYSYASTGGTLSLEDFITSAK